MRGKSLVAIAMSVALMACDRSGATRQDDRAQGNGAGLVPSNAANASATAPEASAPFPSDAQVRSAMRETFVQTCSASFRSDPEPGIDANRLCGCTIDRWMQGRSIADMQGVNPRDPAFVAAERQCTMDQIH